MKHVINGSLHGSLFVLLCAYSLGGCSVVAGDNSAISTEHTAAPAASVSQALTLHSLGNIRDSSSKMAPPAGLPSQVDLSALVGPPGDQGNEGSCVGWASATPPRRSKK